MKLDDKINYIVSGVVRSGTSMMMQILLAGGIPIAFENSLRPSDEHNPKGYFELEGGKIINKLMEGTLKIDKYKGKFIKITAYGLQYLPPGNYRIIYMERNLDEILDSMQKMTGIHDKDRDVTKESFRKLNEKIKKEITMREDINVLLINYNNTLSSPEITMKEICYFLEQPSMNLEKMIKTIDKSLYRQRRTT